MKSDIPIFRLKLGVVGFLGAMAGSLLMPSSPLLAQSEPPAPGPPTPAAEAVTVFAPRVVRRVVAQSSPQYPGSPVEVLTLERAVNFGDLDLTTQAGAQEFQKRILYAALAACDQIESEYPSNRYVLVPASQNCPDAAAAPAMSIAKEIIAAARAGAK
jgi:UrcA family protein